MHPFGCEKCSVETAKNVARHLTEFIRSRDSEFAKWETLRDSTSSGSSETLAA
jgi:hypothetical protein